MDAVSRMVVILSATAVLTVQSPIANAAPQSVPPEPVDRCQTSSQTYTRATAEIVNASRHATIRERRALHQEFVELLGDRDLEPSNC